MSKKAAKPRNRAAQDATLIQIRALKKRVKVLEETARVDGRILSRLDACIVALSNRFDFKPERVGR